jgi:hypothetical protein
MPITITYSDYTFDFGVLPEASTEAMLRRGLTHYLGNEISSKVAGARKRAEKNGEAFGEVEEATVRADYIAKAIEALRNGTVGTTVRGPAIDPVEAEMERIAKAEIRDILKAAKLKFVGAKGEDKVVSLPDGNFTMDELVARRFAKEGEEARIRKAAEKAIRARAKAAETVDVAAL